MKHVNRGDTTESEDKDTSHPETPLTKKYYASKERYDKCNK